MPLVSDSAINRAIANVGAFGDTDVFPFPFENWAIRELPVRVAEVVRDIDNQFDSLIQTAPPQFESTLAPVGYTGFRWVTQIDPFWNLYLLSMLIEIAPNLEIARIGIDQNIVHSYRFESGSVPQLFKKQYGWSSFMTTSYSLSEQYKYVVSTDISEFYRRLNHHRIENALEHVVSSAIPDRIIRFLSRFSDSSSYGIPIGGPAARIISEITINQIDQLLLAKKFEFARFADDFNFFVDTIDDAYAVLKFLSQILITNQGLTLQKSKTRIMHSSEYQQSFPPHLRPTPPVPETHLESEAIKLLKLSLHYDPYSPTAAADYDTLKSELGEIDIVGLLTAEAQKSQINISISRKIVATISHLEPSFRLPAIQTILNNTEKFFPIMSNVLQMIKDISSTGDQFEKNSVASLIRQSLAKNDHVFSLDLHRAYAIRILAESNNDADIQTLTDIYTNAPPFLRRDIMLIYAKRKNWYSLSDLKSRFSTMTSLEQRAYYFCSYALGDEGKHWRSKIKFALPSLSTLLQEWCNSLKNENEFMVRL